ncbi:MAG: hypothetical protein WC651_03430 [Candidatus Gracilibacteria bacterium]|jgi:hypothetical protein
MPDSELFRSDKRRERKEKENKPEGITLSDIFDEVVGTLKNPFGFVMKDVFGDKQAEARKILGDEKWKEVGDYFKESLKKGFTFQGIEVDGSDIYVKWAYENGSVQKVGLSRYFGNGKFQAVLPLVSKKYSDKYKELYFGNGIKRYFISTILPYVKANSGLKLSDKDILKSDLFEGVKMSLLDWLQAGVPFSFQPVKGGFKLIATGSRNEQQAYKFSDYDGKLMYKGANLFDGRNDEEAGALSDEEWEEKMKEERRRAEEKKKEEQAENEGLDAVRKDFAVVGDMLGEFKRRYSPDAIANMSDEERKSVKADVFAVVNNISLTAGVGFSKEIKVATEMFNYAFDKYSRGEELHKKDFKRIADSFGFDKGRARRERNYREMVGLEAMGELFDGVIKIADEDSSGEE